MAIRMIPVDYKMNSGEKEKLIMYMGVGKRQSN